MRINSSTIGMDSARNFTSVSTRISRMVIASGRLKTDGGTGSLSENRAGGDAQKQTPGEKGHTPGEKGQTQDSLTATWEEMNAKTRKFSSGNVRGTDASTAAQQLQRIRQQCINYLIDIFFPERRRSPWQENSLREDVIGTDSDAAWSRTGYGGVTAAGAASGNTAQRQGQALIPTDMNIKTFMFSRQYYHAETENTGFSTKGTVRCADGREIDFNLNVEMSRSFQEYYEENITMIEASMCDPLVINLNGNVADLSDQTFLFDLDGDGQEDEINRLAAGSGFLALDKNGDGVINDGTELFGTQSGNGFADLAAYDTDHNGFIDEGDEIWNHLKIWVMDEDGQQRLYTLAEKGVGAICLRSSATDFSITDENNQEKGRIRRTGFFLYENGETGSVQHVDLALHERKEQERIRQNQGKYEKWLYDMAM